ncbi:MAG TPA: ATP-binding protein [Gemmatimonadaceae bacterium]|nr:ATP-binding protein [Gemmatimonadaceae bacterium]
MNTEPHGERIAREAMPPASFARSDAHVPVATELEAAQRALASEHARLADALSRAESALAMRDEVLAIVAHDLRSPLNAVQTSAAFLMDVELPEPDRRRLLDVIRRASSSMNRLIEDLLDVSRMESGVFTIEPQSLDLAALAREVCEQFQPEATENGRNLHFAIEADSPAVFADRDRISQVLENLISNALRFTPPGGSVTVRVARHGAHEIKCSVADTGVGIAPEDLPHLFERFWQARRYRRGGAGLGLAIARGVVEAHGSALAVESEPGRGSVFSFVLDAEPSDAAI